MFIRKITYRLTPECDTEKDHQDMRDALGRVFEDTEACARSVRSCPKSRASTT